MQSSSEQKDDCSQVSGDPQGTDALGSKDNELDDIGRQAQQGSTQSSPRHSSPTATIGSPRYVASSENLPSNLGALLDIFNGLLQQHEVRLCMALLEAFRACQPLAHCSLVSGDWNVPRVLATFAESQYHRHDEILRGLIKLSGSPQRSRSASSELVDGIHLGNGSGIGDVCTDEAVSKKASTLSSRAVSFNESPDGAGNGTKLQDMDDEEKRKRDEEYQRKMRRQERRASRSEKRYSQALSSALPTRRASLGQNLQIGLSAPSSTESEQAAKKSKFNALSGEFQDTNHPDESEPASGTGEEVEELISRKQLQWSRQKQTTFEFSDDSGSDEETDQDWAIASQSQASFQEEPSRQSEYTSRSTVNDGRTESNKLLKPTGPWIVNPNSIKRLAWDFLGLAFIIAESFCVPISLGFDIEVSIGWYWLTTTYFMMDLVSQFCTGYYEDGHLIMKQQMIAKKYLKSFFVIDVVATMPWEYVLGEGAAFAKVARFGKMLRLFRLLRILRLKFILDRIEDAMPSASAALLLSLMKITLIFVVLCHWVACIWGFLGRPSKTGYWTRDRRPYDLEQCEPGGPCEEGIVGSPWIHRYALDNYPVGQRYTIALQFAAGLLTGADTGMDSGAQFERIFIVLMMIASFLFCSVMLSKIVVVVEQMSHKHAALKHRIHCAKEFMSRKKVPLVLMAKVKRYLEYEHEMSIVALRQNTDFMERLSRWIRLELVEQIHSTTILQHPFFKELSRPLLQRVCGEAHTVLCAPGDIVVHRGHRATGMCYVVTGKLRIVDRNNSHAMKFIEPNSWIGDACLFKDMTWPSTAISLGHSELLTVTKESLARIVNEFPKARKLYRQYQDHAMRQTAQGAKSMALHKANNRKSTHLAESAQTEGNAPSKISTVNKSIAEENLKDAALADDQGNPEVDAQGDDQDCPESGPESEHGKVTAL